MSLDYERLNQHVCHRLEAVRYGNGLTPENVAIECVDCCTVLVDFDRPQPETTHGTLCIPNDCICGINPNLDERLTP